jgi:hypothetical protein
MRKEMLTGEKLHSTSWQGFTQSAIHLQKDLTADYADNSTTEIEEF